MSEPGVGPASTDYRGVCQYHGPTGHGPPCGEPATVHVRTMSASWGDVSLASCDRHAPIARAAGGFMAEHRHWGVCGLPGTVWADEACVIDESGVEPELTGARELEPAR